MKIAAHTILLFFLVAALGGCGASTVGTAVKEDGSKRLTSKEIFSLVNGNTVHLAATDFDAQVYCDDNGAISAMTLLNEETEGGKWDVRDDDTLCLFFYLWFYGDTNCYSVYYDPRDGNYQLFNDSKVLAFTATVSSGNSHNLAVPKVEKKKELLRKSLEQDKKQ